MEDRDRARLGWPGLSLFKSIDNSPLLRGAHWSSISAGYLLYCLAMCMICSVSIVYNGGDRVARSSDFVATVCAQAINMTAAINFVLYSTVLHFHAQDCVLLMPFVQSMPYLLNTHLTANRICSMISFILKKLLHMVLCLVLYWNIPESHAALQADGETRIRRRDRVNPTKWAKFSECSNEAKFKNEARQTTKQTQITESNQIRSDHINQINQTKVNQTSTNRYQRQRQSSKRRIYLYAE